MIQKASIIIPLLIGVLGTLLFLQVTTYDRKDVETSVISRTVSSIEVPVESVTDASNLHANTEDVEFYNNNMNTGSNKSFNDSIPFRYLPRQVQFERAERFHIYGDLKLKANDPLRYEFNDREEGIQIIEFCPNILGYWHRPSLKNNRKPYGAFKVEFYNDDKTLIKKINLEKETPYTEDKYNIIYNGYPDMEYYNAPPQNFSHDENLEFMTANQIDTDPNGFTVVKYRLITVSTVDSYYITDWEETLVIYDRRGELIGKLKVPYKVTDSWVSNDGKKLALMYVTQESNNFDKDFMIYDIESSLLLYEQKRKGDQRFFGLSEIENGFVRLGINTSEPITYYTFFDLEKNKKYSKICETDEAIKIYNNWTNYVDLLKKYSFKEEKF